MSETYTTAPVWPPVTLESLTALVREFREKFPSPPEVRESPFAERRPWVFPKHAFFEWEPKDEPFCRRFGIGHEGSPEPCVIEVTAGGRRTLYVHPKLMAQIREEGRPC